MAKPTTNYYSVGAASVASNLDKYLSVIAKHVTPVLLTLLGVIGATLTWTGFTVYMVNINVLYSSTEMTIHDEIMRYTPLYLVACVSCLVIALMSVLSYFSVKWINVYTVVLPIGFSIVSLLGAVVQSVTSYISIYAFSSWMDETVQFQCRETERSIGVTICGSFTSVLQLLISGNVLSALTGALVFAYLTAVIGKWFISFLTPSYQLLEETKAELSITSSA